MDEYIPLLDVFMPEDLCARCNENEADNKFYWIATNEQESVRLAFCSSECHAAFWRGWDAVTSTEDPDL